MRILYLDTSSSFLYCAIVKHNQCVGEVKLNLEKDLSSLESNLKSALKDEISKGLELKTDKTLSNGFRIGIKNGEAYYDYSAEAVADLFARYLNPRVASIMKNAGKE